MTAAAIPNIFPGSPQVAGENTTFSASPSKTNSFEDFLAGPQTNQVAAPQETDQKVEVANPLDDLFKLLTLLWGTPGETAQDGLSSDPQVAADYDGNSPAAPNGQIQDTGSSLSGFVSELQLLLSMFQTLASAFEGQGKNLPNGTKQIENGPTGTVDTQDKLSAQSATLPGVANIATQIAPGIGMNQESAVQRTKGDEMASGAKPSFPGDASNAPTQTPTAGFGRSAQNLVDRDSYYTSQEQVASSMPNTKIMPETVTDTGREIDLHLFTFSYSRGKGMDISDLHYSGSTLSGITQPKMAMSEETQGAKENTESSFNSLSSYMGQPGAEIKMAKAEVKKDDGSTLTLKKMHVSSAFLKGGSETTAQFTNSVGQDGNKHINGHNNDILSIDFNKTLPKDSGDADSSDTSHENSKTIHTNNQDGPVIAGTGHINSTKGDMPPQRSLDQLVTSQIRDGINEALKMNKNRAILHLNPPELGSVKISVTVSHNNHVQANFVADHPETRHILEANMQHLRESLAENGFSMAHVNVDVGGGFGQWSGAQQETVTPFGLPSMWLKNSGNAQVEQEPTAPPVSKVGPYGMHVIA